jgi:hypothetical protein
VLEHVERRDHVLQTVVRAAKEPERRCALPISDEPRRLLDLRRGELQPELGRLVHRLEQELVAVGPLVRRLLQREQLVRTQIALVVAGRSSRQDRLGKVFVDGRLAAAVTFGHEACMRSEDGTGESILPA